MDNLNIRTINGYTVQLTAEHIYALDEFGTDIMYLVEGKERAMLVDTGAGIGPLKETVEALTDKPVFVVNTHGHVDHALGNHEFDEVYINQKDEWMIEPSYMSRERWQAFCVKEMKEPGYTGPDLEGKELRLAKPSGYITEGMRFDLGDREFEAIGISGHTPSSMVFLDGKNRILISGDSIVSTPILIFDTYSTSVEAYLEDLKKLAAREGEFDLIFPGHFLRPIGKKYLFDLMGCAEEILAGNAEPEIIDFSHMSDEPALIHRYGQASIVYNGKHIRNETKKRS